MPAEAEVWFGSAFLAGWDITSDPEENTEEFASRLEKRENELREAKNRKGQTSLEKVRQLKGAGMGGKIFVFDRHWTHGYEKGKRVDSNFIAMHAHVRAEKVSFDLTGKIFYDSDLAELERIAMQVRERDEDVIPREPGFCFDRGMLVDSLTADQNEGVTMFVSLKDHSDVSIAVYMRAGIRPATTLLQRKASSRGGFSPEERSRFTLFREGARTINGTLGEEVLEKVREFNSATVQSFMWESYNNDATNVLTPYITVEMSTGNSPTGRPVMSSLPDKAALALWDRLTSSLRLRPTN